MKSPIGSKDELKLREMPSSLYNYCKLEGNHKMAKVLKLDLIIIKEDTLYIQHSIETIAAQFGLDKKTFEFPNLNSGEGLKTKCNQFLSLLESFEKEIKKSREGKEWTMHRYDKS